MGLTVAVQRTPLVDTRLRVLAVQREARRLRTIKVIAGIIVCICFWYAVPYSLPLRFDPNPAKAAAQEATDYKGNLSRQVSMPVILVVSLYALWRLPKRTRPKDHSVLRSLLCTYVGWASASMAWSTNPAITLKRLIVFWINLFFMYVLVRVLSLRETAILAFAFTSVVAALAVFADVALLHDFAPWNPDYRFMGVTTANYQAINLAVCLVCGLTIMQERFRQSRWLALPLLCVFALLVLTRARMGTLLCLGMLVVVVFRISQEKFSATHRAAFLLIALLVTMPGFTYFLGRSGLGTVTEVFMMGRTDSENTASLSNRAPLWNELWKSVLQRPLLGFGFEAFWSAERVEQISQDQGWIVPHAHNTYLDQTLSLGVVGAILYALTLFVACYKAWWRYRFSRKPGDLLLLLLLGWLLLIGLTESVPVAPCMPTLIAYAGILRLCFEEDLATSGRLITPAKPNRSSWQHLAASKAHLRFSREASL